MVHIRWNVIFFVGAILMYQVACSCFQLLHRQPSTTCSKKKTLGFWKSKNFFSPAMLLQTVPFYLSSLLFLSAALLEMPVGCREQGQGPGRLGCVQICVGSSCSSFVSMSFCYILLVMTLNVLSFYLRVFLKAINRSQRSPASCLPNESSVLCESSEGP